MKLFIDWSAYQNSGMGDAYADIPKNGGDFAKAVAVCIGSRQCEQHGKGVMCPSFRVTDNPLLSPGGRVKLLKAALNSEDSNALFDSELEDAMNLCVSCKGCKRECENEVDMAQIKAEYLAQRLQHKGLPLRHRLWANLPRLLKFKSLRPLVNWRNRSPFLSKLSEKFLKISAKTALPELAPKPFTSTLPKATNDSAELVLFVDTFNNYFNPQVAEDALALLTAAGHEVTVIRATDSERPLCCGRTYFSNGHIAQAQAEAKRLLNALKPHIDAGHKIIGLEPSCILSLRDEYLNLDLGETAQDLAKRVLLLEEFIAREQTAKRWPLTFKLEQTTAMQIHGHCHQKAVGAMKSMRKVLKTVEGLDFKLIDSSCCGMAGHFGLEAEHYDISQKMAEQALFPALRSNPKQAVVANGFSCQQQIQLGGFEPPLHIAQLLRQAIVK